MHPAQQKIVQFLSEAHATEQALTRDLQSQIAMTPHGSYRSALETHLDETRDHASRVRARLKALGQGANPLAMILGAAESVVAQAVTLGKAPLNLVRGSGGEEKLLKNAKDACAAEMFEIVTYEALEHLARSTGDDETARLAASIRADEEKMYKRLLSEFPKLTEAVVQADVYGDDPFDVIPTGAADRVRDADKGTRDESRKPATSPRPRPEHVRRAPRSQASGATAPPHAGRARSRPPLGSAPHVPMTTSRSAATTRSQPSRSSAGSARCRLAIWRRSRLTSASTRSARRSWSGSLRFATSSPLSRRHARAQPNSIPTRMTLDRQPRVTVRTSPAMSSKAIRPRPPQTAPAACVARLALPAASPPEAAADGAHETHPVTGRGDDLRAAADAGDRSAALKLWERLRDTDRASAESYLQKAADSGDVHAALRLGMLLWERRDVDAAEEMLRSATNDTQGAHALGLLLWRERGNPEAAVEWLDRAAQADDPAAERDLGILLRENGDIQGAHHWLSRAADRDGEARHALAELVESH